MVDFGWQVAAADSGDAGTVVGAMFDRSSLELTALVVRRGAFATREIVVPVEHIVSLADQIASVSLTEEQLEQLEDFRFHRLVSPEEDMEPPRNVDPPGVVIGSTAAITTGDPMNPWTVGGSPLIEEEGGNVLEGSMVFVDGQEAVATEGESLGTVQRLVFDQDDRLYGVVVRKGGLFGSGRDVSLEYVVQTAVDEIQLSLTPDELDDLPAAPAT